MPFRFLLVFLLGILFITPVWASLELAQKYHCMNCHAVDKRKLGPAFLIVSEKYGKNIAPDAIRQNGTLANKHYQNIQRSILFGSKNKWGVVPMPGNAKISQAEVEQLAAWILLMSHSAKK